MVDVQVVGLDIAKSVFQLHGVDACGVTVLQKRLTRARLLPFFEKLPPCLVGREACATSHFWAPELTKLGHEVKLMPAQYVKPYVKRQKNDMDDAEAIAEAVTRPSMRFVAPKSPEQQSAWRTAVLVQLAVSRLTWERPARCPRWASESSAIHKRRDRPPRVRQNQDPALVRRSRMPPRLSQIPSVLALAPRAGESPDERALDAARLGRLPRPGRTC